MAPVPQPHNAVLDGAWKPEHAAALYGLEGWAKGYFGVNQQGHLTVMPSRAPERAIDLYDLVKGLRDRGLNAPVLVRFSDLARDRLQRLRAAFDTAIEDNEYKGKYRCVYPIKVNQRRGVCEEIRDFGAELGFGLEVGSKPELLAVLGMTVDHNQMPVVCNGFKDREFIEAVVLATKLGRNIIPVVERFRDIEMIVEEAQRHGTRPTIGLRIKPTSRGTGKWAASGGMRSKFGLTATEALLVLDHLKRHEMADCLKMVHFHIGSQLSDIRRLKTSVTELAYFYAELRRLGAGLEIIDVGGGLGVDYDGSNTSFASSANYSMDEYASDIVYRIKNACDDAGVPHPDIFSESGRAIVAYPSVLVAEVLDCFHFDEQPDVAAIEKLCEEDKDPPQAVLDLLEVHGSVTDRNLVESFHDAIQARDEIMHLFSLGYVSLPMRAAGERLFWAVGRQILAKARRIGELPEEMMDLAEGLSDIYYCNFSVFRSLPDSWAIDQLFPIMPIHRLDERPGRMATLADITCDSDGKLDRFVDRRDLKRTLEVHELRPGKPYYIGVFLVGAYQEVLGDLHNLFGDTHVVHVSLDEQDWFLDEVIAGDTVAEVLSFAGYEPAAMVRDLRRDIERAVRGKQLSVVQGRSLLEFYESGLAGYTYLE